MSTLRRVTLSLFALCVPALPALGCVSPTADDSESLEAPLAACTGEQQLAFNAYFRPQPYTSYPGPLLVAGSERVTIVASRQGESAGGSTLWYQVRRSTGAVGFVHSSAFACAGAGTTGSTTGGTSPSGSAAQVQWVTANAGSRASNWSVRSKIVTSRTVYVSCKAEYDNGDVSYLSLVPDTQSSTTESHPCRGENHYGVSRVTVTVSISNTRGGAAISSAKTVIVGS